MYDEDDFFTEAEKDLETPRVKDRKPERSRKKKKKKKRSIAGFVITIILLLIIVGLLGTKLFLQYRTLQIVAGEHTETIDISEDVASNAEGWLEDIEGVTVTTRDISECIGELEITIVTKCELDLYDNLTVTRELDRDSYDYCRQKAYDGVSLCFKKVIMERLYAAGIDTEGIDIEAVVRENFGLSVNDYIERSLPDFFPTYEELTERFIDDNGEVNG